MSQYFVTALVLALLLVPSLSAAIWTDRLGDFERVTAEPFRLQNTALAEEYGFEQGESAEYRAGSRSFKARAYQMADATGGLAMFQYLQPEGARPSEYETKAVEEDLALFSVESGSTVVVGYQNYVMVFEGDRPTWDVVKAFLGFAPNLTVSSSPTLPGYLPHADRVPGSARYILGPESLSLFLKEIPAGLAAFSMGAEAQVAEYESNGVRQKLAIVSYPTPQIARKKLEEYQQLSGVVAKRESSLIVLVPAATDRDFAEKMLALVRFRGTVTMNQEVRGEAQQLRDLIINVIILSAILVGLAALAGACFGGLRYLRRRSNPSEEESFLSLHLGQK